MSKINTSFWKKFKISDLFDVHPTVAYKMTNADIFKNSGTTPVLSNSSADNGIGGYSNLTPTEDGNIITFSDTTTGIDTMFYQSKPFIGYPHIQGMYPKNNSLKNMMNESIALFLISVMKKAFGTGWSYANKFTRKIVLNTEISLPVTTVTVPDWLTLEALLKANGGGEVADMSKIDTSSWKKFKVSDLFTSETGDVDLQQKDINGKGVPLISSGESNTGVIGSTDRPAKIVPENTITVDMFGSIWYRDFQYKMVTHARVFALIPKKPINREIGLYLASTLKKLTTEFSYNNMCSWNKIKDIEILLPAQTEDVPDWDLMERYIRAVEKIVIKDVVDFKDTFIAKAKEAITA